MESMSVYWMTIAIIPKGILKLIRQKIFHFIWVGAEDNRKVHLENWELLSLSKHSGGWGLRNLYYFGRDLALKSLRRGIFGKGLWNDVLKSKYLKIIRYYIGFVRIRFSVNDLCFGKVYCFHYLD